MSELYMPVWRSTYARW